MGSTYHFLYLIDPGDLARNLDRSIHCESRSHHDAEGHDVVEIGNLDQLIIDTQFLRSLFRLACQVSALRAASAQNL